MIPSFCLAVCRKMNEQGAVFLSGEIVLDQEPYSSVLDAESKSLRCDACFRCSENLQRCSACKSVSYCCTSCQVS